MNVICLVMDRLPSGYLGAYGNTWIGTPALDRLASQSFVFDQALIESSDLNAMYRGFWQGWPALGGQPPAGAADLPSTLTAHGIQTTLVTDDPAVAEHPLAPAFAERIQLPQPEAGLTAAAVDQTHLALCFAELIDRIRTARPPFLLWCHLGSLGRIWDAPREFRQRFVEEDDPEPDDSAVVPDRDLPSDHDPDEVLVVSQAYAGQIVLWDVCLGALAEALAESPHAAETVLVVVGGRGLLLGEHGVIGARDEPLYSPLVQVPWLIRFPDGLAAGARSQALVQTSDVWPTLLDLWQVPARPEPITARSLMPLIRDEHWTVRDRLAVIGGRHRAIRTPAWYLVDRTAAGELYAKPDDRWEVNDVASRCREVTETLRRLLDEYGQAVRQGSLEHLSPLDEILLHGFT